MKKVLTVTMNPTVDVTTAVDELVPRSKLRCAAPRLDPGGGGVNVSRTIAKLGGDSMAVVVAGGATGDELCDRLSREGVDSFVVAGDARTRESFMVCERSSQRQFRFIMPGPKQSPSVADRASAKVDDLLAKGAFGYLVASGSLPPGVPPDFYGRLAASAREHGVPAIVDTSGAALKSAVDAGLYLLAPNRKELAGLADRADEPPEETARALILGGSAELVAVKLGREGGLLVSRDEAIRVEAPPVETRSTVGAGDCFVAGLVFALASDWSFANALRYAVAAGTAAVMTEATELAHRDDVERLHARLSAIPADAAVAGR